MARLIGGGSALSCGDACDDVCCGDGGRGRDGGVRWRVRTFLGGGDGGGGWGLIGEGGGVLDWEEGRLHLMKVQFWIGNIEWMLYTCQILFLRCTCTVAPTDLT